MTRSLQLMRHASAAVPVPGTADLERPLTSAGRQEASRLAESARQWLETVSLVLCSPSIRTRETARILSDTGALAAAELEIISELYDASRETVWRALRGHAGEHRAVLVIAHNPGIAELAFALAAQPQAPAAARGSQPRAREQRLGAGFPPAAWVQFDVCARQWRDLEPDGVRFRRALRPERG